jgi:Contractile injection system tube protein
MNSRVLQKGALIIEKIEDRKEDDNLTYPLFIEFQFNPDSLKRTLKMVSAQEAPGEQGGGGGGAGGGGGGAAASKRAGDPRDLKNDSNLGETISLTAYFDGKEDYFKGNLLPVLSVLEKLMEPVETKKSKTNAAHVNPSRVVPLVFLWWGERRILPCKITQLSITETEFTPELDPIRAEVGLELELLIPLTGSDPRIVSAYTYVAKKKHEAAQKYSQNASRASSKANYKEAVSGNKKEE